MSESSSRARRRLTVKAVLLGVALGVVLTLVTLVTWLWLNRDPMPALTVEALSNARQHWDEHRVADYKLDLEITGERPASVHVEVRDSQVVAYTNNGRTPDAKTWPWWSVDGLFEQMEAELTGSAAEDARVARGASKTVLRAQFDPYYGYPLVFRRLATASGGAASSDSRWEVTRFEPMKTDGGQPDPVPGDQ